MDSVEAYVEYYCVEGRITTLLKVILTFDINIWHCQPHDLSVLYLHILRGNDMTWFTLDTVL